MRLNQKDGTIDIENLKQMVDLFIAKGFTYFDTAWSYKGSEKAIYKALIERYPRNSYQLATKMPQLKGKSKEEILFPFYDSLQRTNAQYFDNYLLHNLGKDRTQFCEDYDLWSFLRDKKEKGQIKHIGFSFHSTPQDLEFILKKHPEVDFVQLQINYADWDDPIIQSKNNYEVARSFNKPIIVMEPLKGGLLVNPPEKIQEIFNTKLDISYAELGLKFAANLDGVIMVLSGMRTINEVHLNTSYMQNLNSLTAEHFAIIKEIQKELKKYSFIPCTACNYCTNVCPMNIGIPETLTAKNNFTLYNNLYAARGREKDYNHFNNKNSAINCIKCGQCETICPQHISIRKELEETIHIFQQTI